MSQEIEDFDQFDPALTEEEEAWLDADIPLPEEAEEYLATIKRRVEQGLYHHPFQDGVWSNLVRLNADGTPYNPSMKEMLRLSEAIPWHLCTTNSFGVANGRPRRQPYR